MKDEKLYQLARIFGLNAEDLKKVVRERCDLYGYISENTGLSRGEVKFLAHGVMYGVGKEGK